MFIAQRLINSLFESINIDVLRIVSRPGLLLSKLPKGGPGVQTGTPDTRGVSKKENRYLGNIHGCY
jgi:hypothetical protein